MKSSLKVIFNTLCLYGKMIVTTIIALYLTRVVLNYLGTNDFGIYSLIGGVISLLSFVNSALMVSSQRYLSVALGEKNDSKVKDIFSSSIVIHIAMTVFLILLFELCSLFLFDNFLNIVPQRIPAAKVVYQLMIISTVFTVLGVPYNAIINAKEDLWMFSIIESICALLKLGIIIIFHLSHSDALILYTAWIMIVTILNFLFKFVWCKIKYPECSSGSLNIVRNRGIIRQMLSFSSWNAFGTLALIGRNQGAAIVLNMFWGTAINAVYGIANQVNSQLIYFSTMMTTSMAPQIMKSYGEGNTKRMLSLSVFTCKLSFFLSAIFAIPLLIEMNFILRVWLKDVPEYTGTFCTLIVYMFLFMQLTPGLSRAIQATGKIKWYQILTSVLMLLPIPIAIILGYLGDSNLIILYAMIISQACSALMTVYLANRIVGLDIKDFLVFIVRAMLSFIAIYIIGLFVERAISAVYSEWTTFFIIVPISMISFASIYYLFVLDPQDKERVINVANDLRKKKKSVY